MWVIFIAVLFNSKLTDSNVPLGQTPNTKLPALTFDEYQCSGHVETDFLGLCALLDVNDIPTVVTRPPASPTTETEGGLTEDSQSKLNAAPFWFKPRLQVELENGDPHSTKKLMVLGWKVDEKIARVLQKMFPSLSKLQSLQFWQAGLTDQMVVSLMDTVSLCSNLRAVTLEGNHLPEQSYHLLLSEDSVLTYLSLRNNRMGDKGAQLIGSALSTTRSANKNLLSLNLAFNSISDAGATHIAQGLRFNRSLLILSLCNNHIGDSGAAHLAAILGEFALTHEEVVERRKMLLERTQSVDSEQTAEQLPSVVSSSSLSKGENKGKKRETSKKDEKPAANKENPKSHKKSSDTKTQSKGGKHGGQEKPLNAQEQEESMEMVNPLLDQPVQYRDGELFLPGNKALNSLNLAGNRITKKSLPLFLTSLEMQGEGEGLLRLCLQREPIGVYKAQGGVWTSPTWRPRPVSPSRPVCAQRIHRYQPVASGNASFSAAAISSPTCHSQKTCCTRPLRRRRGGTRRSVLFRVLTLTSWM